MNETATMHERLQFTLGDRLHKALVTAGLSNQDMADELEVSRNTISNYVNGNSTPKRLYLRVWAMKTGVPLEWLETGELPGDNKTAPTLMSEGRKVGPAGIEPTTITVKTRQFAEVIPLRRSA